MNRQEYIISQGTGAGERTITATLEEAKALADESVTYTQTDLYILDADGEDVAWRQWVGTVSDIDEQENPIRFGDFGFYADWIDL